MTSLLREKEHSVYKLENIKYDDYLIYLGLDQRGEEYYLNVLNEQTNFNPNKDYLLYVVKDICVSDYKKIGTINNIDLAECLALKCKRVEN